MRATTPLRRAHLAARATLAISTAVRAAVCSRPLLCLQRRVARTGGYRSSGCGCGCWRCSVLARVVAQARPGGRNSALFWSTCRALEHVAAEALEEVQALDALSMAALETGLGGVEIRATIDSARRTTGRQAA